MENRISSDYIVNTLMRRFGFKNLNVADIIEHIGDVVGLLGYGLHTRVEYKQVPINFFRISYPCNTVEFYNVYYKGRKVNRKTCNKNPYAHSNPFSWLETVVTSNIQHITTLDKIKETLSSEDTLDDREDLLSEVIDSFSVIDKYNSILIDDSNWIEPKKNIIETSIEQGNVYVEYSTFALDDRGYPYLHNEQRYLDAVVYYCSAMLIQSGYIHPTISLPFAIERMETYIARARNYEKRFTEEQANAFKNSWTNLLKDSHNNYKYSN